MFRAAGRPFSATRFIPTEVERIVEKRKTFTSYE
jgi:hypothetical protein